ncbi:hypothetical protein JZX86_25170 [Agrobacterium rosae]|uniref:hypothetical protein n=1 Tax=Agrobacterium rosae TaxID=1972867 RepID=UPI0019D39A66|nr:hypothetical protein [Agrobacterium rosae]MBN7808629.1 hypothetical protein [Agrobacterium rosae]
MPIMRALIQTVVLGKTPDLQPSSLRVDVDIASIMAFMEVLDSLEQRFLAAAQTEVVARPATVELAPHARRKRLLDALL